MKRTIVAVALALNGLTFSASPVFAETQNSPPNAVDTSQWKKIENPICFSNGVQMLRQVFFYENKPLHRIIYRYSVKNKVLYEHHVVDVDGEGTLFNAHYIKSENVWIHYAEDELDMLMSKLFPEETSMVACEK